MSALDTYFAVVSLLFGLAVGSFLNVVIHRLPEGRSLVRPESRCPSCDNPIRWRHNVPIVGWVLLRGRCYDCGQPISVRYPLVEAITGFGFLAVFLVAGLGIELLVGWAFFAALVAVAFIDLDHYVIPNKIVVPGAILGLLVSVGLHPERWWEFVLAGLGAGGFLLVLGLVWPGSMGLGDVKLAVMMGAVLGRLVLVAMFVAFLVGGVAGITLLVLKLKGRRDKIPFGPYLAIGAFLGLILGDGLLDVYTGLYS